MKKLLLFSLFFSSPFLFSQLTNVNDTLPIEKIGKKIEIENDLAKCKKWNDQLLAILKIRKNLGGLHPKVKQYYVNSYQTSLLTDAYFEEEKGNYKKAIAIQLRVLKELENQKTKNNKLLGYVYRIIGTTLSNEKEYAKAKYYIIKAIPFALKDPDQRNTGSLYNDLGFIFRKTGDYKNAYLNYNKSLIIFKKLNYLNSIANCLDNLGTIQMENKEYSIAYSYYQEAIVYNLKTKNHKQLSDNYLNITLLETKLNNEKKAISFLKKAYDAATKSNNLRTKIETTERLHQHYKKSGQENLALKYLEENIEADRILNKEENKNAMLKAEFNYETEKKEAQVKALSQQQKISQLESQKQKTITLLIGIGAVLSLIIGLLVFKRFKANKQNELLKIKLLETEKTLIAENKATESELKALKSQMNPHFIFNALNSIQEQFMFGDKLVANEQMGNFTSLTRQILTVSGKKKIPLSLEIDILTKYLELEKLRFETDFEYNIHFDENIDDQYTELPPMLIQPFVENSIKHGLLHKAGFKKLSINFSLDESEDHLICIVEDNGIGREKSAAIKTKNNHQSFSTESVAQRLQLLGNNDNEAIHFEDLKDENGNAKGTRVVIKIYL